MGDVEVVRNDLLDRPMTQLNGHWFAGPEIDGHLSRLVIDRHRDAPTSPLQRERQPIPVRWKVRVDDKPVFSKPDTPHAEDSGLPEPPEGSDVNSSCRITPVIGKIDRRSVPKITRGQVGIAEPGAHEGMKGGT